MVTMRVAVVERTPLSELHYRQNLVAGSETFSMHPESALPLEEMDHVPKSRR